jgi:hypothetical protein
MKPVNNSCIHLIQKLQIPLKLSKLPFGMLVLSYRVPQAQLLEKNHFSNHASSKSYSVHVEPYQKVLSGMKVKPWRHLHTFDGNPRNITSAGSGDLLSREWLDHCHRD